MKALFAALVLGAGATVPVLAVGATLADGSGSSPNVTVNFDNWQKYTDIKDSYMSTDRGEQSNLEQLRRFIERDADRYLPNGDKLTVSFQDIDLAGEFEPWRGAQWDDVRIVKEIYPPRFRFTWSVADAAGKVVKAAKEDLTDTAFYLRLMLNQDEPLRFEKQLLSDWMSGAIGKLK